MINHKSVLPFSTEMENSSINSESSIVNDEHLSNNSDKYLNANDTKCYTCCDSDNIDGNDALINEMSKGFSNNLNNVELLVKKLSMMENMKSNIDDNILKESVKTRPLVIDNESCKEIERNEDKEVYYRRFSTEDDLQPVIDLITKDLSEPYSIYTYRYFIYNWPKMCIMAFTLDGKCIGAIVGKTESHASTDRVRGYIAMLAVQKEYRRRFIGSRLVELVIDTMINDGCSEVVLETEITNKSALSLYEKLGFIRDKRLFRYYLNGVDAFRLKLWMS